MYRVRVARTDRLSAGRAKSRGECLFLSTPSGSSPQRHLDGVEGGGGARALQRSDAHEANVSGIIQCWFVFRPRWPASTVGQGAALRFVTEIAFSFPPEASRHGVGRKGQMSERTLKISMHCLLAS